MKKALVALGIGAVAVSLNMDKAYADSTVTVNVSALNVRSGPGTDYSKTGTVYKGTSLTVLETNDMWYHVKLSNGSKGWVYSSYVKKASSSTTTYNTGSINISAVNVRSGPGNGYSIKKVASYGTKVKLLNKSGGWCNVELPSGTTGWIYQKYINFSGNTDTDNDNNTSNGFTSCNGKVTCKSNLNVRSGPSTGYSIKAKLTHGQVVKLTDKSNGWYKVSLTNGTTGWVKDDYIKITTESVTDNSQNSNNNSTSYRSAVVNLAYSLLGKPYAWGGNGPNCFDCSGFTSYVYKHAEGKTIPRVSSQQAKYGTFVSRGNYLPGDLLYFATTGTGNPSHVGIYVGNNTFIHASGTASKPDKVKLSTLTGYYSKVLLGARRF